MKFYLIENQYVSAKTSTRTESFCAEFWDGKVFIASKLVSCAIISISKTEEDIEKCEHVDRLLCIPNMDFSLKLGVSRIKNDEDTHYKGYVQVTEDIIDYLRDLSGLTRIQVEYQKITPGRRSEPVLHKVITADVCLSDDYGLWEDTNVDFPVEGFKNSEEILGGFFTVTVTLPDEVLVNKRQVRRKPVAISKPISLNQKILEQELLSDVTITTGDGTELKAHKVFLASQSSVFQSMFSVDMIENQEGKISIPELPEKSVRAFLCYLYYEDDSVRNADMELVFDLLYAAHKYHVEKLENLMPDLILHKPNDGWFKLEASVRLYMFAECMTPVDKILQTKMLDILKSYAPKLNTSVEYINLRRYNPSAAGKLGRLVFPSV